MTSFSDSNWARPEFSQGYRDNADFFIVERDRMLSILASFYSHYLKDGTPKSMLDLGCGDGIVTAVIADIDAGLAATLLDGSVEMLNKARERLAALSEAHYIHASFQELLTKDGIDAKFDFIASSLAIHHLAPGEKISLFQYVWNHLKPGGHFVNIDVILAPSDQLEEWYLSLWRDWIHKRTRNLGVDGAQYKNIVERYKDNGDNKPDTLESQIKALRSVGFRDVDCFYKYGIFSMFGGEK